MRRRYEGWGEFLKKHRESHYRSAREFCSRAQVGISYPQYSRYEAGDQLPNLEQALHLCRLLEIPVLEGLLEWSRTQIADSTVRDEVEALLEQVKNKKPAVGTGAQAVAASNGKGGLTLVPSPDQAPTSNLSVFTQATISLDDIIVFNRSHLKLFNSHPGYRDIFTYVNSYAPEWITSEELAIALELPMPQIEEMLDKLSDLGVILLAGSRCRASKRNFYFPDDEDFFGLRNMNLTHNTDAIMKKLKHQDLLDKQAYRGLLTRELTQEQVEQVFLRMDELLTNVVAMPETTNPEKIYSLCLLMGERFHRPSQEQIEGLRRGDSVAVESFAKAK